jgi:transposase
MRGKQNRQIRMLLDVSTDGLVPAAHPLRQIRVIVETVLLAMSPRFEELYAGIGRPSIPPEYLLKGTLLMALYSIRSERQLCEQLRYNLLFKWFLDLNIEDEGWDHSTFSKNRARVLSSEIASEFLAQVVAEALKRKLISSEHFTADGTLIDAWASIKSFRPREEDDTPKGDGERGRNVPRDFHGERRTNDTHASRTDPEARMARKGNQQAAKPSYCGHVLMDNRAGMAVDAMLTLATGTAERDAATTMARRYPHRRKRITLGADKGYDTRGFVASCREDRITPHVAQNKNSRRDSAIDARTTRHAGYKQSQRVRKRVEEGFGWLKTVACTRKLRYVGREKCEAWFKFAVSCYNLVRMAKLATALAA